jgi:hypothetical protein
MQQYPLRKRASATGVSTHRAGHSSRIHPKDVPYWTDQENKYANPLDVADGLDYPGEPMRAPSSAIQCSSRGTGSWSSMTSRRHDVVGGRTG